MKSYKLRAECLPDIIQFINKTHFHIDNIILDKDFTDVELEFTSCFDINYLKQILEIRIEDSHVMQETLQLIENYTGERI